MHRLGERFMYGIPLVLMVLAACSGDDNTATPTVDSGTPPVVDSGTGGNPPDSAGPMALMIMIPVGATGKGTAGYDPNPATVSVGTTVTWMNADPIAHTATSTTGVFDSGSIPQNGTYSFTFNTAGSYPYFCTIHGAASMSGTVIVQ
jgi:plastocyanin